MPVIWRPDAVRRLACGLACVCVGSTGFSNSIRVQNDQKNTLTINVAHITLTINATQINSFITTTAYVCSFLFWLKNMFGTH